MGRSPDSSDARKDGNDPRRSEEANAAGPSRMKRGVFVLIATIGIPLLLLGLTEAGLRIAGYGYRPGFLVRSEGSYQSNPRFGWRFFPRDISRAPLPIHLSREKPSQAFRIVIVGGSAARGYPEPAFSFSRYLQAMLWESFPDVQFEVANAAMTAANSHMMVPAARDCLKLEPDLLIVYMGNNEVVGPYGPGTVFAGPSASLPAIRMGLWVRGTRLGQLLGRVVGALAGGKGSPEWAGMEMFLENQVLADDPRLVETYDHFRSNVRDICGMAAASGAKVLVCTVPVNLRQCAPFASVNGEGLGLDDSARWLEAYVEGAAREQAGQYEGALASLTEAMALDDRNADLHFRLGRCYVGLDRPADAYTHFRQARDLDALRFRADTTINDTLRQVAGELDGPATLVDVEKAFEAAAEVANSPGEELFFDHVHPNYRGNYELALSVFPAVVAALPAQVRDDRQVEAPTFERCNERLAMTHLERLRTAGSLWQLTQRPPFTNQLNYRDVRKRMLARREALWAEEVPAAEIVAAYQSASASSPEDATLHVLAATIQSKRRNFPAVAAHLAEARRLTPNDPQIDFLEATMHLHQGDLPEADRAVGAYLDRVDHSLTGYIAVINMFGSGGSPAKAEGYARRLARRRPGQAPALTLLAKTIVYNRQVGAAAYRQGLAEAEDLLTKATEIQPEYPSAWLQLGEVQRITGRTAEAATSFRRAVELDPSSPAAYVGMGTALFRLGRPDQARTCLARAIAIAPDDVPATTKYAELLCMEGNPGQAVALLRRALRIDPDAPVTGLLAWVLATSADPNVRNGAEAVRLAEIAVAKSGARPSAMLVLAAAYAAEGQFPKADAAAEQALAKARRLGETALAERLVAHRVSYAEGQALSIARYDRLEGW